MRLTNSIRDAFVTSVINDVPKETFTEKAESILVKAAIRGLPPKVQEIYNSPSLRHFVATHFLNSYGKPYLRNLVGSLVLPGPSDNFKLNTEEMAELQILQDKLRTQETKLGNLKTKLRGIAYGVTTRKALADLLPEFEKYLPRDFGPSERSLPVISNVVSEFIQAGWPKVEQS
jgi:hypothetical protein